MSSAGKALKDKIGEFTIERMLGFQVFPHNFGSDRASESATRKFAKDLGPLMNLSLVPACIRFPTKRSRALPVSTSDSRWRILFRDEVHHELDTMVERSSADAVGQPQSDH